MALCIENILDSVDDFYQSIGYFALKESKEIKKEVKNTIKEETKIVETKTEEEVKEIINPEVINMEQRKKNPVIRVKPVEGNNLAKIKVKTVEEKAKEQHEHHHEHGHNEEHHHLLHTLEHLNKYVTGVVNPVRTSTGLLEVTINNKKRQSILISIDFQGLLYNDALKFFIGRMKPGKEYTTPCYMMCEGSLKALDEGNPISNHFLIPESQMVLNTQLDLMSLRESDYKKRSIILEHAAKALTEPSIMEGIAKATGNKPYRFAFARCKNANNFTLVSSKRNLGSNLDKESFLKTNVEIWIDVKNKEVKLTSKVV